LAHFRHEFQADGTDWATMMALMDRMEAHEDDA
jgi:hypothetical protein